MFFIKIHPPPKKKKQKQNKNKPHHNQSKTDDAPDNDFIKETKECVDVDRINFPHQTTCLYLIINNNYKMKVAHEPDKTLSLIVKTR